MASLTSAFIKLINKLPKLDKKSGIYNNGIDNNYAELVESVINNSVTALRAKNTMANFLTGKGFGDDLNNIIVNKEKGTTLLKFLQDVSDSIAEHNGVFIHVNWNAAGEITSYDVIPFANCRVGKKDDNNYSGKIKVCDDWSDKEIAKKAISFDVYNDNEDVIEAQAEKAGGFDSYKGQIFYHKFGKYTYPLAPIHPALEDADSEKRASTYKNVSLRKGFFGKTLVVTKPLIDPMLDKEHDAQEYRSQVSERDAFRNTIKEFVGAENVDGVMHLEMELESDDIDKEILFKNIDSNIDDKLFSFTEKSCGDNICTAYGVPHVLIKQQDSSLFAASGELIYQAKEYYQDQTESKRLAIEQIVNKLIGKFTQEIPELEIIPLIDKKENNDLDN